MRLHIQEISESASSVASHDLSDLVPTYSGHGTPAAAGPTRPPRAITYEPPVDTTVSSCSSGVHSNSSSHPAVLIPTISPPRYQVSLSYPGSPPERNTARNRDRDRGRQSYPFPSMPVKSTPIANGERRVSDGAAYSYNGNPYPPEARRAPPSPPDASQRSSAPTMLQSFASWDPTWRSGGLSTDGHGYTEHVPADAQMQRVANNAGWVPEYAYEDDDPRQGIEARQHEQLSEEQQAKITEGQYRLGVGYDDHAGHVGSGGGGGARVISEQRKMERLRALEKEFGRSKAAAVPAADDDNKAVDKVASGRGTRKSHPAEEAGEDEETETGKMTFKQLRAKQKADRQRIDRELGITNSGNLRTEGKRTRLALRWCQGLLGLVAVVSGLGGAFFTNPPDDDDPPPSGAISTYFLYIVSFGSLLCSCYLFLIQPCVHRRRHKASASNNPHEHLAGQLPGGLVLPIFSSGGQGYNAVGAGHGPKKQGLFGNGGKKSYSKKNGRYMGGMGQPMTVNLVVDPSMLAGGAAGYSKPPSRYDDSGFDEEDDLGKSSLEKEGGEEEEEEDHDFHIPDSRKKRALAAKRQDRPFATMLDTMTAMKLQDKWREARRRMRIMACVDASWAVVWFAEAIFAIGFGKSCKPGSGNGWCDTYNMALASGALLSVAFSTSFVFDILDLRRSRSIPRLSRTV